VKMSRHISETRDILTMQSTIPHVYLLDKLNGYHTLLNKG
jgi:hypothetical protein